jgi:hypothetical protein
MGRNFKGMLVVFAALSMLAPALLAVLTAGVYVSREHWSYAAGWTPPQLILVCMAVGLVFLLLISLAIAPTAQPQQANPGVANALRAELAEMKTRVGDVRDRTSAGVAEEVALIQGQIATIEGKLNSTELDLSWVFGSGYVSLWRQIHRLDEALVALSRREVAASEGISDVLRINGSAIPNRRELSLQLTRATPVLCCAASRYIAPSDAIALASALTPTPGELALLQPAAAPVESGNGKADEAPAVESSTVATATLMSPDGEASREDVNLAFAVVRKVRRAVNDFRDDRREGLVRARTTLAMHVLATSTIAYLLLLLVILTGPPTGSIVAVAAFFLVGALVGLYRQLGAATNQRIVPEEDYGLHYARLVATPLFSGLAGAAGVYLAVVLSSFGPVFAGGTETTAVTIPKLSSVYDLSSNAAGLLVAAVFGLTPNLIITRLQAQAEAFKADIKSAQLGEQKTTD